MKPEFKKNHVKYRGNRQRNFEKKRRHSLMDVHELVIEKMVQGGQGMARLEDGRVCFVSGALPGELCKVALTFNKKDFTKGKVIQILEPSEDRVNPRCPLYGTCGGCSLQHLKPDTQAKYMEQVERENFRRLAHSELPQDFKIHCGTPWGYRNRARVVCRLKDSPEGTKVLFGFREQESNRVVEVEQCPVLTEGLNQFLQGEGKRIFTAKQDILKKYGELEVNLFDDGNGRVSYYYRGMHPSEFSENSISIVEIAGKKIQADASVFFQSNLGLLPALVESVRRAVDDGLKYGETSNEWLIDLFSGVGFFAAILQDKFKRITTVERDEGCLKHAKVNLSAGKEECGTVENVSAPAEEWLLKNVVDIPATLIVDPPRTGLPKEALDAIISSSVNRLIYVSCDPVTLARDYAKFAAAGFALNQAEGFAFYPQTPHLEMMFVLVRRS